VTTKVSVGILAHNEEPRIERTLRSLFEQDVFKRNDAGLALEVLVVPNGCKDGTARKAESTLQSLTAAGTMPHVSWKVCDLAEPGKSRSWNVFVHQLSAPDAEFLILMDGDIEILDPRSLGSLVKTLQTTPEAHVSVSRGVKDIAFKKNKGLMTQMSLAVSTIRDEYTWISGSLYCGRAAALRRNWMPIGLPVEDGYLWGMVVTDCHTKPLNGKRVVSAPEASHMFEAVLNPVKLIRHERRIIIGMAINSLIWEHLKKHSTLERDAGVLVRDENTRDPGWFRHFIDQAIAAKNGAVIPREWLFRRFSALRYSPPKKRVVLVPVLTLAFNADLFVYLTATWQLKSGKGVGFW
jgi:glycosyltransferase involved in cell wall biosynthesis